MRSHLALALWMSAPACGFQVGATVDAAQGGEAGEAGVTIDAAIDTASTTCADAWYGAGWAKRNRIALDSSKVTGSPTEIPVLIDVVITGAQPTGKDLVFTASDGVTRLPHEIEKYEPGTGRLIAWVRIPMLSSAASSPIYIYSGNPSATNQQDPAGVWAPDYASVWHLGDNPSGSAPQIKDSAVAARHATVRGGLNSGSQVQGKIAGSIVFDGNNEGLDVASLPLGASFTYEAWIYPTTNSSWRCIVNNSPAHNRWFGLYNQEADFWDGGTEYRRPAALSNAAWHHVAATYDGTELRLYRDGVQRGAAQLLTLAPITNPFQIGYTDLVLDEWFAGQIDEVRVSRVARSAAFLATTFSNQNAPGMFAVIDAPETCP